MAGLTGPSMVEMSVLSAGYARAENATLFWNTAGQAGDLEIRR